MSLPQNLTQITSTSASQVKQLARWGKGTISQIAWAPRSRELAIATALGIYLEDAATLNLVRFLPSDSAITSLAFSSDEKPLVSNSADDLLERWRASDGLLEHSLKGHTD